MSVTSSKISFEGANGDTLAARLDRPAGTTLAYALFAHCFTCGKDIAAASRIASALAAKGIAVLRFDFTGLGHSEGEFANTNFSSNVQDLLAAADYLRAEHQAPQLLIGHSLGGAAVLAAAGEIEECRAVATVGAPADPDHVAHLFDGAREAIERDGEAEVTLAGRSFKIQKQFLDDIAGQNQAERIAGLRRPLIVFHGPRDEIVGIDNATAIFTSAKHPKSFISLDDADHLLSRRADALYVAAVLPAWASRYLDLDDSSGEDRPDEGAVLVEETRAGKFTQRVIAGRHELVADEPKSVGGDDTGPTPYDYLLAGLGACTSMTMRLYADRKELPLDRVKVQLRHDKIHAEDCADCETKDGKIDRIVREIEMVGDLDDAQRAKLLEIADKCPVHRTLHSEVKVETSESG